MAKEVAKNVQIQEEAPEVMYKLFNVERRPRFMQLLGGGSLHLGPKAKSKPVPESAFSPEILNALAEGSLTKEQA